jgi:hypothetical protein
MMFEECSIGVGTLSFGEMKWRCLTYFGPRGVHSLLFFAYTCVRDLFIEGVIYLAEKIIR